MPQIIQYGPVNAYNAGTPGLELNDGIITVNFTPQIGGGTPVAPQAGQLVSIQRCVSIPPYGSVSWFANKAYPAGYIIVSSVSGGVSVFQMALNGGTSGSTKPAFSSTIGTTTVDDVGSGYSAPPITWICVQPGESWNFNGLFHVKQMFAPGQITVTAASQFAYFNPLGTAYGGADPIAGYGDVTIMTSPEPILEIHSILEPAQNGILYQPTVAFQQGVIIVQLADASPILTEIWNQQQNANQLSNPMLSQLFVRLIDCQTWYGVQVPGLYAVLAVLGPPEYAVGTAFCVTPKQSQFLPNDFGGGGLAIFLKSLSQAIEPGLLDLSDSALQNSTSPVCDDVLIQMNHTAKMGAVRVEVIDCGYYRNGDQVAQSLLVSAVDGYKYAYEEVTFDASFVTGNPVVSGSPYTSGVFEAGDKDFPGLGATDPTLVSNPYVVAVDSQGNVTCEIYASANQAGVNEQGAVRVIATCQRESTQLILPVQQLVQPAPWTV